MLRPSTQGLKPKCPPHCLYSPTSREHRAPQPRPQTHRGWKWEWRGFKQVRPLAGLKPTVLCFFGTNRPGGRGVGVEGRRQGRRTEWGR